MTASAPILVVGAGPTGLALAFWLARREIPVRIIDKAAGPGEASRAMVVHARTLEFYDQLGFAREVVDRGIKVERFHLREGGKEVAQFAFGDIGQGLSPFPFLLCFPQDDHERLLGERLRQAGIEVEWDTALTSLTQDEAGAEAVLQRDGAEERVRTPYLCGCDGAHSAVRHALELGFEGGSYEQLFYVADVEMEGGDHEMVVTLDAHTLGLKLPVRSSGMQRLIGLVPPALSGRHDLQFDEIRPEVERLTGMRVRRVNWFSTYHVHHRVAARFRVGRCFLAGDAGHVHSPAGGQGMNTGIGDAVNLAWKLADVVQGRADEAILDTYEPERIAFARVLVSTTDRAFQAMVGQGKASEILRTWLMPHLFPMLTGFSPVRRLMFRTVSQTRIAYHDSALSAGRAGEVQGGDRLPWVGDADNFAALRSRDWQVHVYGNAPAPVREEAGMLGLQMHVFAWTKGAESAGLERDATYLVRPDGYVGLAARDGGALRDYAARIGLRQAVH
ncbi:MAG TPA: FAD-dependent monooxygenase [Acetobacteraceae bacterium]|nr:FAD-dependent monooxygenase [Acetobacteraceae bacterium]